MLVFFYLAMKQAELAFSTGGLLGNGLQYAITIRALGFPAMAGGLFGVVRHLRIQCGLGALMVERRVAGSAKQLDPFAAAGDDGQHGAARGGDHIMCCSCGMCFSAAVASESDQGSMNLASIGRNNSPAALQWSSP